jgi:beta-N-acetylhexosaminidase
VEEAILRIYGPDGTGQVAAEDIASLPFGQLKTFLAGGEVLYDVGTLLREADWVIFAPQDLNPVKGPNSDAVELFLNSGLSASYNARFVVLAFNAPYYLDTTEISKLSLYVAAYSKVDVSVEAAVRALFGELTPHAAPPVDVTGINYDLQRQLAPDPDQVIPLSQVAPALDALLLPPVSVHLQAGPVLDHNGHPVPDGTLVTFYAEYDSGTYAPPQSAVTSRGVAETAITLNVAGPVRFHATGGDALRSESVALTIQPLPTDTPAPTPPSTATRRPVATPSVTPSPTSTSVPAGEPLPPYGVTLLVTAGGYLLLGRRRERRSLVVRWLALAVIGGMAGYLLYALQVIRPEVWGILPAAVWMPGAAAAGMAALGALVALGAVLSTTHAPGGGRKR